MPRGPRAKKGHLICFQGQEEKVGVVMVGQSWDAQQDTKYVVVTLDIQGAQKWRPHFLFRLKLSSKKAGLRINYVCVCVSECVCACAPAERWFFWNLSFTAQICLLSSSVKWLLQQRALRHCFVFLLSVSGKKRSKNSLEICFIFLILCSPLISKLCRGLVKTM